MLGYTRLKMTIVTYSGDRRERAIQEREHSHMTYRYIGEDNMGHMGYTLWALTNALAETRNNVVLKLKAN